MRPSSRLAAAKAHLGAGAHPRARWRRRALVAGMLGAAIGALFVAPARARSEAHVVPPLAQAQPAAKAPTEVAVLAGGCFWGTQGVYQHVKGVSNAVSGYAGGEKKTAVYEIVGSGATGHAEAVQITYDPRQISFARLLQIYFSVVHDPTQLNRQGPDVGTQYRSAIFPLNDEQAKVFKAPIATKIEPGRTFYPAEAYHQDFLVRNPTYPYIVVHDLPKIEDLKRLHPDVYRAEPVLVATPRP